MTDEMAGLERVLIDGDLSQLSDEQRVQYYARVCESVGLNPVTQPLAYIRLSGKLTLYALRSCTDQLRKIQGVSVQIVSREQRGEIHVVTARATARDGRTDESIGAVPTAGLRGENLANALMKAETKAKRRVTLAICGLSLLDESEADSVPRAVRETQARRLPAEGSQAEQQMRDAMDASASGEEDEDEAVLTNELLRDLLEIETVEQLVAWRASAHALPRAQLAAMREPFKRKCTEIGTTPDAVRRQEVA